MFNDTPAQKIKLAIGRQTNGIYIKKLKSINMYILKNSYRWLNSILCTYYVIVYDEFITLGKLNQI